MRIRQTLLWLSLPLLGATAANAQTGDLVIGTTGVAANCVPLGCAVPYRVAVWQQVYDASNFSGPASISTVKFYSTAAAVFSPAQYNATDAGGLTYTVSLSTTNRSLAGLATPYTANLGSDNTVIGTRTLSGTVSNPVSFGPGPSFQYDPSRGNLLVTIQMTGGTAGNNVAYFDSNDDTGRSARAYFDSAGIVEQGYLGVLVTGFEVVPGNCAFMPLVPANIGRAGGSFTFAVTGGTSCFRAAASNVPWLTITSGAAGTGSGSIGYSAAPNATGAVRTGTITVAARTFSVTQAANDTADVTVTSVPAGMSIVVDGSAVTTPATFNWIVGSTHTIDGTPPPGTSGARYAFSNWSDSGAQSHIITVQGAATYTATYRQQYYLTTSAGDGGTISPASGWYDAGTQVSVQATPNTDWNFDTFSGDLTGRTNPQAVAMTAPRSVTAAFQYQWPTLVAVSPLGEITVDETTVVTNLTRFYWAPGSRHTLQAAALYNVSSGVRAAFARWDDGGTGLTRTVTTPQYGGHYPAYYNYQYYVTTSTAGNGTVTPASGWHDQNEQVTFTATPGPGAFFIGFSGNGNLLGDTNPQTMFIGRPTNETASFGNFGAVLTAAISSKTDGSPGTPNERIWYVTLKNTGTAKAWGARITNVEILQVVGSATVTLCPSMTLPTIATALDVNASATWPVRLMFPATTPPSKIQIRISFDVGGGVTGSSTFSSQYR
jgi:hypothetical protein